MKKVALLMTVLPLFFTSCIQEEDYIPKEPVVSAITKTELESVPSFSYMDERLGSILYIKFRDGKLYTKQITSDGSVCNENIMDYIMTGDKIDITHYNIIGNEVKFDGTIHKITQEGEPNKLKLKLDPSKLIAEWLSNTYEWSNTSF